MLKSCLIRLQLTTTNGYKKKKTLKKGVRTFKLDVISTQVDQVLDLTKRLENMSVFELDVFFYSS